MKAALHSLQSVSDNGSHPLPAVNFQHPDFPVFRGSVYQCPAGFLVFPEGNFPENVARPLFHSAFALFHDGGGKRRGSVS